MTTKHLALMTSWVRTESLQIDWYDNGQMWYYVEWKDGVLESQWKQWDWGGMLLRHYIYKNGKLVKQIV